MRWTAPKARSGLHQNGGWLSGLGAAVLEIIGKWGQKPETGFGFILPMEVQHQVVGSARVALLKRHCIQEIESK